MKLNKIRPVTNQFQTAKITWLEIVSPKFSTRSDAPDLKIHHIKTYRSLCLESLYAVIK